MLINYKDIEPIVYQQMCKSLNRLSHAYLFNLNDNIYANDMIMDFIKSIICKNHQSKEEYSNCILCKRIEDGNYTELKKIYPDGLQIKKEALEDLQRTFSTKSLESNKRIYVIYGAEKLNKSAANSLLKFLEEPADGIIAILITNNINLVFETIISRCQVITFKKNNVEEYIEYNNIKKNVTLNKIMFSVFNIRDSKEINEENKMFLDNVIRFIRKYEITGKNMIIYEKELFLDCFKERETVVKFLECLILFYDDVLNYKINGQVVYYDDYIDDIKKISSTNGKNKIINKLNVIINSDKNIRNNLNINLLLDSMIIDMEGGI